MSPSRANSDDPRPELLASARFDVGGRLVCEFPVPVLDVVDRQTLRRGSLWELPRSTAEELRSTTAGTSLDHPNLLVAREVVEATPEASFVLTDPIDGVSVDHHVTTGTDINRGVGDLTAVAVATGLCRACSALLGADLVPILRPNLILVGNNDEPQLVDPRLARYILAESKDETRHVSTDPAPDARSIQPEIARVMELISGEGGFGAPLARVLARAADANPERRFADLEAFGAALSEATPRRHRVVLGPRAASVIVAVLSVGLLASEIEPAQMRWLDPFLRSELAKRDAKLAWTRARSAAELWDSYSETVGFQAEELVAEATRLMQSGDADFEAGQDRAAEAAYSAARSAFEEAIANADRFVARRAAADDAERRARHVAARWSSLLAAAGIDPPSAVADAEARMVAADRLYVDGDFERSRLEYDAAQRLFESVSDETYQRLAWRHRAEHAARGTAAAVAAWQQLASAVELSPGAELAAAEADLRAAEVLMTDEQYKRATEFFTSATTQLDKIRTDVVENLIASERAYVARSRVKDLAARWRSLAASLEEGSAPAVDDALKLTIEADAALLARSWRDAQLALAAADEFYIQRIGELNERLRTRATDAAERIELGFAELRAAMTDLEARVQVEHERVSLLARQLAVDATHESSLALSGARAEYDILQRSLELADRHCSPLTQAPQSLLDARERGAAELADEDYAAAWTTLDGVADELTVRLERVRAIEDCLRWKITVESDLALVLQQLGPVARALPEIESLLSTVSSKLEAGADAIENGTVDSARRELADAEVALSVVVAEARLSLLTLAQVADADNRRSTALQAIEELLRLAPDERRASELRAKILSAPEASFRVAWADGGLRFNGRLLSARPTRAELELVLGPPQRTEVGGQVCVYDDLGLSAAFWPDLHHVNALTLRTTTSDSRQVDPGTSYDGSIELFGVALEIDSPIDELDDRFPDVEWSPARVSGLVRASLGEMGLLLDYGRGTARIRTVSFQFPEP